MKQYADEDDMRDDLREVLDKEWQQGYDKGTADERAAIVEWLRDLEGDYLTIRAASELADIIEEGGYE
jgi:hypothetical protein